MYVDANLAFQLLIPSQLQILQETERTNVHQELPSGKRVLLVDDTMMNITLGKMMLEKLHCSVTQAYDGLEALHLLKSEVYDLVLMDISMPEMSGTECVSQYRIWEMQQRTDGHRMHIYAHTSKCTADDQMLYNRCGFDGFIPRPCNPRRMHELISSAVGVEGSRVAKPKAFSCESMRMQISA